MNGINLGAWAAGAFAGLAVAIYIRRKNAAPADPEEKLRELIGPQGMALRDKNRAPAEEMGAAEVRAAVECSSKKLRESGDAAGAEKLEAYAETLRARRK